MTVSSSSISFLFTTYGGSASGGGAAPTTVTSIVNNSSLIPSGFPNGGMAPSTLFQIQGKNMASATTVSALQDSSQGLPTTLNGATVTIQSGSKTWTPGLYYAIGTQIAGVIPHDVPPGPAMISVSYNNNGTVSASAPLNFTIVQSAFAMDVYNGNYGVLQDSVSGAIITPTNSAKPGEIVTLWGTGLGSDPSDSDTTLTSTPHAINTAVQIYLGTVQVPQSSIAYVGSLGYPGVNGVVFTVPSGVQGCGVSLVVVANNVSSNTGVVSVMPNGGVCQDSFLGIDGNGISGLTGKASVKSGFLSVSQSTSPGQSGSPSTTNGAFGSFQQISGSSTFASGNFLSLGSCSLSQTVSSGGSIPNFVGLDAGTITLTPPGGSAITMQTIPQAAGSYQAQLSAGAIPTSGGTVMFSGSGGKDVGSFTTTVNFPNPLLSWTNQSASATVNRSQGINVTWSGGAPGSTVVVFGTAAGNGLSGSFTCNFPQSALQGTVPSYITSALPAGSGNLSVENSTSFNPFSATGLDYGFAIGSVSFQINSTYQ